MGDSGEMGSRSTDDYLRQGFERSLDNIADDLRRLVETVERAKRTSDRLPRPYLSNATNVVQSVLNTLPNLNLALLIDRAHDCETIPSHPLSGWARSGARTPVPGTRTKVVLNWVGVWDGAGGCVGARPQEQADARCAVPARRSRRSVHSHGDAGLDGRLGSGGEARTPYPAPTAARAAGSTSTCRPACGRGGRAVL